MKIFLDDVRKNDNDDYSVCRTYKTCIMVLKQFRDEIEIISLDYDLGYHSKHTGYDVIKYMFENNIIPKHINIHSTHPTDSIEIEEFARNNFPNSKITTNKIKNK